MNVIPTPKKTRTGVQIINYKSSNGQKGRLTEKKKIGRIFLKTSTVPPGLKKRAKRQERSIQEFRDEKMRAKILIHPKKFKFALLLSLEQRTNPTIRLPLHSLPTASPMKHYSHPHSSILPGPASSPQQSP